ncbi:MAG: hypothetical protein AAF604_08340 [Acidobacteriota bacterium]
MRPRKPLRSALWLLTLSFLAAVQLHAQSPSPYDEVLRLLEGDLSESVILAWLDGREEPLPRPTADQLLALKAAGASDDLLGALLAATTTASDDEAGGTESKPAPRPSAVETPTPTATPAPASPTEPSDDRDGEHPEVEFQLSYRLDTGDDTDTWNLYIYLDGKPLSYVPLSTLLSGREPLRFRQRLAPGRHLLRVALERHDGDDGERRHRARFAPQPLLFNLQPGIPASIEVTFRENALTSGKPLSWSFQQGSQVDERRGVGGDPERWPYLCGETESRRDQDSCRSWEQLWRDLDPQFEKTTRQDVLRALEIFDFRPVPRDS